MANMETRAVPPQKMLAEAVIRAGGQTRLAREIGCSQPTVHFWLRGEQTPSPRFRVELEERYGIPILSWDDDTDS